MMRNGDTPNEITCLVEGRNVVGESPLWHPEHDAIYWTDVNGFLIQSYRIGDSEVTVWRFDEPVCSLSLTTDPDRLIVALGSQLILWTPGTDERTPFARPEPRTPFNRLNDGATDPNGAFWVGSMRNNVAPDGSHIDVKGITGSLYRIAQDGTVSVRDTGFGITNTVAWSADWNTFYCGCSVGNVIYAYDYDPANGSITRRRPFFAGYERGVPDGSAVDAEGYLWNCRFFGGCILRIAPDGRVDRVIEMPVSNVTNCAFGGSDLRTLHVTTASLHAKAGERLAGSLFAIPTGVPGLRTSLFRLETTEKRVPNER
jgi:sugar lactone lactonase YvrE